MGQVLLTLLDGKNLLDHHHPVVGSGSPDRPSVVAPEIVLDTALLLLEVFEVPREALEVGCGPKPRHLEDPFIGLLVDSRDPRDRPDLRVRQLASHEEVSNAWAAPQFVSHPDAILGGPPAHPTAPEQ